MFERLAGFFFLSRSLISCFSSFFFQYIFNWRSSSINLIHFLSLGLFIHFENNRVFLCLFICCYLLDLLLVFNIKLVWSRALWFNMSLVYNKLRVWDLSPNLKGLPKFVWLISPLLLSWFFFFNFIINIISD